MLASVLATVRWYDMMAATVSEIQARLDKVFSISRLRAEATTGHERDGIRIYTNEILTKTVIEFIEALGYELRNIRSHSFEGLVAFFDEIQDGDEEEHSPHEGEVTIMGVRDRYGGL